jgi:hypothetical protein
MVSAGRKKKYIWNVIEIKAQLFFGDLYVLCGSSNLAFQASDPL